MVVDNKLKLYRQDKCSINSQFHQQAYNIEVHSTNTIFKLNGEQISSMLQGQSIHITHLHLSSGPISLTSISGGWCRAPHLTYVLQVLCHAHGSVSPLASEQAIQWGKGSASGSTQWISWFACLGLDTKAGSNRISYMKRVQTKRKKVMADEYLISYLTEYWE